MKQRGTMEESRLREMFLFFILILQFTVSLGAVVTYADLFIIVRAGEDVTLSPENVAHNNCHTNTWSYSNSDRKTVELVNHGQIKNTRSDRLSLSANCSLVLKKVRAEDVGVYNCRQQFPGTISVSDAAVHLYLVQFTERHTLSMVSLSCSLLTNEVCKHRVKWLFDGNYVTNTSQESSSSCSAVIPLQRSHYIYTSRFNFLSCEVKTEDGKVNTFTFNSHPTGQDEPITESAFAHCENPVTPEHASDWWRFLAGSLGLVALIAAVIIIVWTKTE
ncbi:PREDICTED: uncharacterized protein LOC107099604, partial [Cyprinodon variegatus]|uniref:uncharacterized protein LOC107099604 n=1 Tax=Cyprinodon variegatus TaxID=28743 RepID=UPI000742B119